MIVPHYRPSFSQIEADAVRNVIESGYLVQGSYVWNLEKELARFVNKKFGVAVSSGTTALTLALKALGVSGYDEVIIPSYTCTALWHAVKAVHANPVLADIETTTFNLDPVDVRQKISNKTKAIIFPHMFGQPGQIQTLIELGIPVIEDIAQAFGSRISGQACGSFGKISISSFYATKVLGAGEGGILFTDDSDIYEFLRDIRDYDEKETLVPRMNAKMTDITAAIAIEQFNRLPKFSEKRQELFKQYTVIAGDLIKVPNETENIQSNIFRCILTHPEKDAEAIIQLARMFEITIRRPVFRPIHHFTGGLGLPNTDRAWNNQVSIPIFPTIKEEETEQVLYFLRQLTGDSE